MPWKGGGGLRPCRAVTLARPLPSLGTTYRGLLNRRVGVCVKKPAACRIAALPVQSLGKRALQREGLLMPVPSKEGLVE